MQEKRLSDLKASLNVQKALGGKPMEPMSPDNLLGLKENHKKDSSRRARMNSFRRGAQSLILPNNPKVSLLKPSMSSIAIRKCGLEKIEDGLDEAQSRIKDLKRLTQQIERRIPMLCYKSQDGFDQIMYYIKTYYLPVMPHSDAHEINEVTE